MSTKPLTLYSHPGGPNPWKVAIIMNELNVPYETKLLDFTDLKKEPFESICPNGRSGAIIEYLLETYDKSNALRYTTSPDKFLTQTWLHFQTSGQGPYFGQRAWFTLYAPKDVDKTYALERYGNEIKRVISVIDGQLKKQKSQWLVGDKVTYADLSFVPWFWLLPALMGEGWETEWQSSYPEAWAWYQRMQERAAVKKAFQERQKAMGQ